MLPDELRESTRLRSCCKSLVEKEDKSSCDKSYMIDHRRNWNSQSTQSVEIVASVSTLVLAASSSLTVSCRRLKCFYGRVLFAINV